jgi:hypothetical protein
MFIKQYHKDDTGFTFWIRLDKLGYGLWMGNTKPLFSDRDGRNNRHITIGKLRIKLLGAYK